jgi:hypothetical protein
VETVCINSAGDGAGMQVFCSGISADLSQKEPDTGPGVGEKSSKKPLFFSDF